MYGQQTEMIPCSVSNSLWRSLQCWHQHQNFGGRQRWGRKIVREECRKMHAKCAKKFHFYAEMIKFGLKLKAYFLIWNRMRSQNFWNFNCLHLFIALLGGYLVERWVQGCATQIGCLFSLSGFMAPSFFKNLDIDHVFCKMLNCWWIFPLVYL